MHIISPRSASVTLVICILTASGSFAEETPVIVLSPFEVTGTSDHIYNVTETSTGTIVAKPRDEIPFVTSVITSSIIEDLKLTNPSDFATQFAGVAKGPGDQFLNDGAQLGSGTSFTVRGFSTEPLYNGFQTGPLNVFAEGVGRVEVTKGANSILYGQSSAGGTINFVPKEAMRSGSIGKLSFGASSNDGYRGTFETGGMVAGQSESGFRIGGGYQEHTRQQQFYSNSQSGLYGAYRARLTESILLEVNAEANETKTHPARTAAFVSLGSGPNRVTDPNNRLRNDRNFNYHGPHSYREGQAGILSGYLTADLTHGFTLRLGALFANQDENANSIDGVYGLATGTTATGFYQHTFRESSVTGYKADLLHQGVFRNFEFDSILGFESHESWVRLSQVRTNPAVTPIKVTIPFERKALAADYPTPPARSLYTTLSADNRIKLWWTNLRFTQFVTAPDDRGTLMWGFAQGEGENTARDFRNNGRAVASGKDTTYTVGGTYVIHAGKTAKWTAFANTSTSFLIQGGNRQNPADFTGFTSVAALRAYVNTVQPNAIDPQTGEGYEVGIRYTRNDGKLRIEVLGYQQERGNIARDFFVRESNVIGEPSEQVIATYQLASGIEESTGVEVSVNWNPTRQFSITASALLSNGEVVSNEQAPEEVGFQLVRSPEKMYNIWLRYAPGEGALEGFAFGVGATYRNPTRTFPTLPDRWRLSDEYTLARALVSYEFGQGNRKHKLSLNVENLLDEEYVSESGILSEPLITHLTYSLAW